MAAMYFLMAGFMATLEMVIGGDMAQGAGLADGGQNNDWLSAI